MPVTLSVPSGDVPVTTSVRQTFVLNNGNNVNSNSLAFPSLSVAVAGTGFTRVTSGVSNNCGSSLAGGATCNIVVQFQPTSLGAKTGSLTISGNGGATALPIVALNGAGVPQTFLATVSPSPLDFGHVIVTTNSTLNLTVTNTGNSAIGAISGIGTNTSPFSRITGGSFPADAPNCGSSLAPGASCTVKVRFAPTAVGAATATVTVNGTVPTVNTVLTGIGDAPPAPATPTGGSAQRGPESAGRGSRAVKERT